MDPKTFHSKKDAIERDRVRCINDAFYFATRDINNQSIGNRFKAFAGVGVYSLSGLRVVVNDCDNTRDRMMDQIVKDVHNTKSNKL